MTKIQIKTRLHDGIYKSSGGGETRLVAEWGYGPRNLVKAYRFLLERRASNKRSYGNIGCGHTWLCTDDGRTLDSSLVHDWPETTHAELVAEIEGALMTPEQHEMLDDAVAASLDY
jgi:hypothetical protein